MRTSRTAILLGLFVVSAHAQDSAEQPVIRSAPEVQNPNAPSEAQLTPPPSAEKSSLPDAFLEVQNPAFPARRVGPPKKEFKRVFNEKDLAPYFATGALAAARSDFDRQRFAQARAALVKLGSSLPVRYLRALAALRAEQFAVAAEEMTELVNDYPAMGDRALVHAGLAREELGQHLEAALLFAQVPPESRLYTDARQGLSRSLRRWGDEDGAIWAIEPLAQMPAPMWGRDIGAESLMTIADLSKARKDVKGERKALWTLWSRHPLSPLALSAQKRLKGQKADLDTQVTRGEVMIEAHRNEPGMKILEPLLPSLKLPDPLACRAHFAFGKALRKQREHSKAIAVLTSVASACQSADLRPRVLYVLGSSRSIVDVANGHQTYDQLAKDFPEHPFADDALFFAADLHAKSGQTQAALTKLEAVADRYPKGDYVAEALFKSFWIHRAAKKDKEAFAVLDRIEKQFSDADETYEVERAKYWRARLMEEAGKVPEALDLFERLAIDHPATYYGLTARSRLLLLNSARAAKLGPELTFPKDETALFPLKLERLETDRHFLAAVELFRLGFLEAAAAELLAVSRSGLGQEPMLLLVHMMSRSGDERSAHNLARSALRNHLSGRLTARTRAVWRVAYPNAFRGLIEKHCQSAQIDPDLLQALMREESALDPTALSWAGALGLTQLMPATATSVANGLKIKKFSVKRLLEPDLNIQLGAWFLGSLVKRWDGNIPFALASYNAGPGQVSRWRAQNPGKALDEWVEEIPVSETRGYVKRVLRSYNTYQLLYARTPPLTTIFTPGT